MERRREMKPKRIQRKRTKGWKMPESAVYIGRPSKWGNPYVVTIVLAPQETLREYKRYILQRFTPEQIQKELAGKHLVCWCPLNQVCHGDILLEIANEKRTGEGEEK